MNGIVLVTGDYHNSKIMFRMKNQGKIVPLANGKLIFNFISKATGQRVGGGECKILNAQDGLAEYQFKAPELDHEGEFEAHAVAELSQGARRESSVLNFEIINKEKIPKQ